MQNIACTLLHANGTRGASRSSGALTFPRYGKQYINLCEEGRAEVSQSLLVHETLIVSRIETDWQHNGTHTSISKKYRSYCTMTSSVYQDKTCSPPNGYVHAHVLYHKQRLNYQVQTLASVSTVLRHLPSFAMLPNASAAA